MQQNSLTGGSLPVRPELTRPGTAPESAGLLARARRSPRLGVILVAVLAFALEMAVSARYGYHRDELYFLEAGRHPAFGYVDQPPLTPLLARLSALLFANSLVGLRVLPAIGLSALVLLTAGMSRILGAGRAGQVLAAVCAAGCAEFLGAMHLMSTTTPDFVAWAVLLYLVLRLLDSGEPRWWLAIGLCTGIAAEAKWTIWFLAAAVVAGFAVTSQRRLPVPAAGRGHRGRAGGPGPDLASGARLAEPGCVPCAADRGRAQPGHVLAGSGGLHRPRPHPGVGGRAGLVPAQ